MMTHIGNHSYIKEYTLKRDGKIIKSFEKKKGWTIIKERHKKIKMNIPNYLK